MHDEIAHLGVVDGFAGLALPGRVGGGVVGVEAYHVKLAQVLEVHVLHVVEFTAEHHMQELGCGGGFFRRGAMGSKPLQNL
jgi:hypothetical protein